MALNKELIKDIITVTSEAAISCYEFIGKNKKKEADKAATDSMRNEINDGSGPVPEKLGTNN